MAVTINTLKYIPDLPAASAAAGGDLLHLSQGNTDKQLTLTQLARFINDLANPVGSMMFFATKGKNPNTLFPGQTWVRYGAGRSIRVCADNESNLGAAIGQDSIALSTNELPYHNHSSGSLVVTGDGSHIHDGYVDGVGDHAHSAWTDAQGNHTHRAWTDAQGAHQHNFSFIYGDFRNTGANIPAGPGTGNVINLQTDVQGNHAHNVGMDAAGNHGHNVGIGASGAHNHHFRVGGGGHSHGVGGATAFNGAGAAFGIVPATICVAAWQRTA